MIGRSKDRFHVNNQIHRIGGPAVRMRLFFRTPESYYPLLRSMAFGKHRLSEIAKDVDFANNKCGKYLDALIDAGFVVAEHDHGSAYAKYELANTYYTAWCRYAYLC